MNREDYTSKTKQKKGDMNDLHIMPESVFMHDVGSKLAPLELYTGISFPSCRSRIVVLFFSLCTLIYLIDVTFHRLFL